MDDQDACIDVVNLNKSDTDYVDDGVEKIPVKEQASIEKLAENQDFNSQTDTANDRGVFFLKITVMGPTFDKTKEIRRWYYAIDSSEYIDSCFGARRLQ